MGMLDELSKWAGRERDRIIDSNSRLIDPNERAKISKGERTPYRDKVIDNDFHPDDQGLNASQEDHWGTVKK